MTLPEALARKWCLHGQKMDGTIMACQCDRIAAAIREALEKATRRSAEAWARNIERRLGEEQAYGFPALIPWITQALRAYAVECVRADREHITEELRPFIATEKRAALVEQLRTLRVETP